MKKQMIKTLILVWVILLSACASMEKIPSSLSSAPAVTFEDDYPPEALQAALKRSISYYEIVPASNSYCFGEICYPARKLRNAYLNLYLNLKKNGFSEKFHSYLSEKFIFLKSSSPSVLFTGYYLPELNGSLKKDKQFHYPLYKKPDDLYFVKPETFPGKVSRNLRVRIDEKNMRLVPYYSREEIDSKDVLEGKEQELIWVDDPIDAFFLHIQGSGIVRLPDGSQVLAGYAEKNGQAYFPIGKKLLRENKLDRSNISMQSIKKYLKNHPDEVEEILNSNPSYIFFRIVKGGPVGSIGQQITAGRTIATDRNVFPKGALALIKTEKPIIAEDSSITGWEPFSRLVLNQDTGGAIKGTGRVDLFTGWGPESEITAGHMKQRGELYFLAPKDSRGF